MTKSKLLYIVMFLLVLLPCVSSTSQWERHQKNDFQWGYTDSSFSTDFREVGTTSLLTTGSDFQPLAMDLDRDGTIEIIGTVGNFLTIWHFDGTTISKVDEYNVGTTQRSSYGVVEGYLENGRIGIVLHDNNNISLIEFNGSALILNQSASTDQNIATGIVCGNFTENVIRCYYGDVDGNLSQYNVSTNTEADIELSTQDLNLFEDRYSTQITPAFTDIDRDGKIEIVMPCQVGGSTSSICVFQEEINGAIDLDTEFSGDGILSFGNNAIAGVVLLDIDGGDDEIILTTHEKSSTSPRSDIRVLKSSGDITWSVQVLGGADGGHVISTPIPYWIVNTLERSICAFAASGAITPHNVFSCYKSTDGTPQFTRTQSGAGANTAFISSTQGYADAVAGGLSGTVTSYNVIVGATMLHTFDIQEGNDDFIAVNFTPSGGQYHSIIADVTGDGIFEVCGQAADNIFCSSTGINNSPPSFLEREFGRNVCGVICLDTTVTFKANECGNEPCHYSNDVETDTERLSSTCGVNISIVNGTFQSTTPKLSCFYNTIGSYRFEVYLQDNSNPLDFSQVKLQTITVINGTSGTSCNIPCSAVELDGKNTTSPDSADEFTSEDEIKEVIELFTMQSAFVKTLMSLIFTLMAMFGLAKYTGLANPMSYAVGILALWILFALLDILPWAIVLIYAIVAIGLTAATYLTGNNST